ncbi:MAG: zf-HC2 domain-containing protein [Candidatus Poribacteria bacterium]|jgi:anti-sigma factor RsiW|nr:zf-HC2 domain-containing protein [Candidatus Poribacteria bacterium]MDP6996797.1 zf-HC2 domain-containing protein [Candidatus Poribacteria bacterium]
MSCTTIEDNFSDYLEDSLPAKLRQSVADHLRSCPNCQREFDLFQQSVSALQQLPEIEPSAFFDTDLQIQLALTEMMPPPERVPILDQVGGKFWQLIGSWRWVVSTVLAFVVIAVYLMATRIDVVLVSSSEKQSNPQVQSIEKRDLVDEDSDSFPFSSDSMFDPAVEIQQNYVFPTVTYSALSTGGRL